MELILNDDQLQQFDTEGWLFFENVFNAEEIALVERGGASFIRNGL